MEWHQWYGPDSVPGFNDIAAFVNSALWEKARHQIENDFQLPPRLEYSRCSMQKGWNIKYKKGGRALCTLYPMSGHFLALVVIGRREEEGMTALLPKLSDALKEQYERTPSLMGGRWLMIDVDSDTALDDLIHLARLRAAS